MWEVITESVSPVNLVPTVLLCMMVLYWIFVILGALDLDFLNVDLGFQSDVDVDADIDMDGEIDAADGAFEGSTVLRGFLAFIYVGEVPVMILFTLFVLSFWTISLFANHYLNPSLDFAVGMLFVVPNLIASILVLKVVGRPFVWMFRGLNRDYNVSRDVVGRECVVISSKISTRMGQAEVPAKGAPIILNCRTIDGQELRKGQTALVVKRDQGRGIYLIKGTRTES